MTFEITHLRVVANLKHLPPNPRLLEKQDICSINNLTHVMVEVEELEVEVDLKVEVEK